MTIFPWNNQVFISKETIDEYGFYYFENCSDVEEIEVEEGHPHLYSVGNCIFKKGEMKLLLACKNSQLPAFVRRIARFAFARLRGLGDIEMPYAVETIDSDAFKECDAKSVRLSESLIRLRRDCNHRLSPFWCIVVGILLL